jgi:predicted GNAT family acetyltransferase
MSDRVFHNIARSRFECGDADNPAICEYQDFAGVWHFTHTYVPNELRGRGIAERLVRFALETAGKNGKGIDAQCSYVAAFLERHPEYKKSVNE